MHVLSTRHFRTGHHDLTSAAFEPVAKPRLVTSDSHLLAPHTHAAGVSRPVLEQVASKAMRPPPHEGVQLVLGARLGVHLPIPPPRPAPAGGVDASHESAYTPVLATRTLPSPERAACNERSMSVEPRESHDDDKPFQRKTAT